MTGDDRLRAGLVSLEESAPTDKPPRRAAMGRGRWVPIAMSAAVVVVAGLMVGITVPPLLDTLRPSGSSSPVVGNSDPPSGREVWEWSRYGLPGRHAWVWDMIVTREGVVAVGSADGAPAAWYSTDGTTWDRATVDDVVVDSEFYGEMTATRLTQVYEQDGQLLAMGLPGLGTPIGFVSVDSGRTWLENERFEWHEDPERWSGGSASLVDVVPTPIGWIAAGHRATPGWAMYLPDHVAWSSPDGHVWSVMGGRDSPLARELEQVSALAVDSGTVYAVGNGIWKSVDGQRWEHEQPPIPRQRGGLDGVANHNGTLIVSEAYGEDRETLGGRIWARVGGSWREELSLTPPSSIDTLAEYSFGLIATGTRNGIPAAWQRDEADEWHALTSFEIEPGWIGAAVEFQGRLLVSGSLSEPNNEGLEVSRQAVVWIGTPPSQSSAPAVDCNLAEEDCDLVLAAASDLLASNGDPPVTIVIGRGRGLVFHAQAQACFADGSFRLIDVIGKDPAVASVREGSLPDNPCQ